MSGYVGVPESRIKSFGRFLESSADKQRFFLVGRGKSGTTWLAQIARMHPRVAWKGERKMLERTEPYEPLLKPFLTGDWIETWLTYSSFRLEIKPAGLGEEFGRLLHDYTMFRALVANKINLGQISHFGDKIALTNEEDALFVIKALDALFPGCKVVHIMRDGRDVAVSELFHRYRNSTSAGVSNDETKAIDNRLEGRHDRVFTDDGLRRAAHSWGSVVTAFEKHGPAIYGDRFLSLRYEDLLADRRGGIEDLFAFLGLELTGEVSDEITEASSFSAMTKGRSAGEQDLNSFYRKGVSGDWKGHFEDQDRAVYSEMVGELLIRFGFEKDADWVSPGT